MDQPLCPHGTPLAQGCGMCAAAGIGVNDPLAVPDAPLMPCSHGLIGHEGCVDAVDTLVDGPACRRCGEPVKLTRGSLLALPANATLEHAPGQCVGEGNDVATMPQRMFEVQVTMREVLASDVRDVIAEFVVTVSAPTAALGYRAASDGLSERWNKVAEYVHIADAAGPQAATPPVTVTPSTPTLIVPGR